LYVRRSDGQFVQLICKTCKREKFQNQLGFVNHCRILHKIKFVSYADAAQHCGVPVPDHVVPLSHPARLSSTFSMFLSKSNSTPSKKSSKNDPENISRFYVKKRIIVGNTSKFIPPEKREASDRTTHKWMVYVRGGAEKPDISDFVKKVRFFLHPSFSPNDTVDVVYPPFHLTRRGWGEFPIRVQLHFVDTKNKPVDIIHHIKLDKTHSGLQMLGGETPVDIELGRNFYRPNSKTDDENDTHESTDMNKHNEENLAKPNTGRKNMGDVNTNNSAVSDSNVTSCESGNDDDSNSYFGDDSNQFLHEPQPNVLQTEPQNTQLLAEKQEKEKEGEEEEEVKKEKGDYGKELEEAAELYPIISDSRHPSTVPYTFAQNINEFKSFNFGKRKSSERQRARHMRRYVEEKTGMTLTTKDVLVWCRENHQTPHVPFEEIEPPVYFCKYCGAKWSIFYFTRNL